VRGDIVVNKRAREGRKERRKKVLVLSNPLYSIARVENNK
jgi:hypothetical protein